MRRFQPPFLLVALAVLVVLLVLVAQSFAVESTQYSVVYLQGVAGLRGPADFQCVIGAEALTCRGDKGARFAVPHRAVLRLSFFDRSFARSRQWLTNPFAENTEPVAPFGVSHEFASPYFGFLWAASWPLVAPFTLGKTGEDHYLAVEFGNPVAPQTVVLEVSKEQLARFKAAFARASRHEWVSLEIERHAWEARNELNHTSRRLRLEKAARFGDVTLTAGDYDIVMLPFDRSRGGVYIFTSGNHVHPVATALADLRKCEPALNGVEPEFSSDGQSIARLRGAVLAVPRR